MGYSTLTRLESLIRRNLRTPSPLFGRTVLTLCRGYSQYILSPAHKLGCKEDEDDDDNYTNNTCTCLFIWSYETNPVLFKELFGQMNSAFSPFTSCFDYYVLQYPWDINNSMQKSLSLKRETKTRVSLRMEVQVTPKEG